MVSESVFLSLGVEKIDSKVDRLEFQHIRFQHTAISVGQVSSNCDFAQSRACLATAILSHVIQVSKLFRRLKGGSYENEKKKVFCLSVCLSASKFVSKVKGHQRNFSITTSENLFI